MLPRQIYEIQVIAIELATMSESRERAEKILQLIEEAKEETKTAAEVDHLAVGFNGDFTESKFGY